MKVLIIEDELIAQQKMQSMLHTLGSMTILATLGSVKDTIQWLESNPPPDLAFVDIQLSDDHSFEIFRRHQVNFPVIFTTAYDKYLLESFEYNCIDYLLKPISIDKLKRSIEKVQRLKHHFLTESVTNLIQGKGDNILKRIVARKGTDFIVLDMDDVAYFYTEHKIVFVRDFEGRQLILDTTLTELEDQLSKEQFFRINRKYLSSLKAIEKFKPDSGKISVFLKPGPKENIHVSKENAPLFREWISGK